MKIINNYNMSNDININKTINTISKEINIQRKSVFMRLLEKEILEKKQLIDKEQLGLELLEKRKMVLERLEKERLEEERIEKEQLEVEKIEKYYRTIDLH